MIHEYLLQDNNEKQGIEKYKPDGVNKKLFSIGNNTCWYVQFSINSDSEHSARLLSEVDAHIKSNFHVTTIENGASVYLNKRLYPLICEFENRLRKLLYLTGAINPDEKLTTNLSGLEYKDLGETFTMLFIDLAFMSAVKEEVKNRNREVFSKSELILAIQNAKENVLWDKLLGAKTAPTLRKSFNDIRVFRNDVMHFHHVDWEKYKSITRLYKTVNKELRAAINAIETCEIKPNSNPEFNPTLDMALQIQRILSKIAELSKPIESQQLSLLAAAQPIMTLRSSIDGLVRAVSDTSGMDNVRESVKKITDLMMSSKEYLEMQEQQKRLNAMLSSISEEQQHQVDADSENKNESDD